MDFFRIMRKIRKDGTPEIVPEFRGRRSSDLMVRGGKFRAIWDEKLGFWSTDEYDVYTIVDEALRVRAKEIEAKEGTSVSVRTMEAFSTGALRTWNNYISSMGDRYSPLDTSVVFANDSVDKDACATKSLPYALEPGDFGAWDELVGMLYSPEERAKIEWVIGAIVKGDSKSIQKFLVFYGDTGTGKSTILDIIEKLFAGYTAVFDAKALGSNNGTFATEMFKTNPLVAIQHDGDLSRIEDNTKLNSVVSHERITINEKYRTPWTTRIESFLLIGTNTPVKISDARSGIIRRLIDVQPTGNLFTFDEYQSLMSQIEFQLGAIAFHCLETYNKMGKSYYNKYRPTMMMFSTNVFFNFIEAYFDEMNSPDGITLKRAWVAYKEFCEDSNTKPMQMHTFRSEMQAYFTELVPRTRIGGQVVTNLFIGFKKEKLSKPELAASTTKDWTIFDKDESLVDAMLLDQPAQQANKNGKPTRKWINVDKTLADIDTTRLHFVKLPEQHIVIDFDIKDEQGEKSLALNLKAIRDWVPTYAEVSKSGQGIHLHYIYSGDVHDLVNEYSDGVEIKTLLGDASLRRKFTQSNDLPVAIITSGLPIKEHKKMLDIKSIESELGLRKLIARNLKKEIHPGTKPSIDFIKKILDDVYEENLTYDVSDLRSRIIAFANNSTNRPLECLKIVQRMKFKSEEVEVPNDTPEDDRLVFFDVEVYPNLFIVCWKYAGVDTEATVRMINPTPLEVEGLFGLNLVGFNNRRYDNHILYARYLGYDNEALYNLSQRIIDPKDKTRRALFGEAYRLSHADVYDFSSKKQGLKKFQIELGLTHQEMDHPWDEPLPEDLWDKAANYCVNDVVTTEQVFNARAGDFKARQILAELSGLTVNDTTQRHTAKIIFGDDRAPQSKFVYTDLSKQFPGYRYEGGKSTYRDEDPSEGGYVYAEPGMYKDVAVLDVASMHPTSIVELDLFGPHTQNFQDLVRARLAIKNKDYTKARRVLDGKLAKFVDDSDFDGDTLSFALKIVINIVYGLTAAAFDNPFRDVRNKDNIVAKRGALFMIDLRHFVEEQGFSAVHIKTDSIKIPGATEEIIEKVKVFGLEYGYVFEHETTYDVFCLVNHAVYIARTGDDWDAVGAQFQHPYVFKTLFTHEPIVFEDYCETKNVTKGAIYIDFDHDRAAALIEDMHFVGRTGSFVPVTNSGGTLYRVKDDKTYAVTGTKGYEWMEADVAKVMFDRSDVNDQFHLDMAYFDKLTTEAVDAITQYGPISDLTTDGREDFATND